MNAQKMWRLATVVVVFIFAFLLGIVFRLGPTPVANPVVKKEIVNRTIYEPRSNTVFIDSDKEFKNWPLRTVVKAWNKNYRIKMVLKRPADPPMYEIRLAAFGTQKLLQAHCRNAEVSGEILACWIVEKQEIAVWTGVSEEQRSTVLCHELGHMLGLQHYESGCMYPTAEEASSLPSKHNLADVYWLYFWMEEF